MFTPCLPHRMTHAIGQCGPICFTVSAISAVILLFTTVSIMREVVYTLMERALPTVRLIN